MLWFESHHPATNQLGLCNRVLIIFICIKGFQLPKLTLVYWCRKLIYNAIVSELLNNTHITSEAVPLTLKNWVWCAHNVQGENMYQVVFARWIMYSPQTADFNSGLQRVEHKICESRQLHLFYVQHSQRLEECFSCSLLSPGDNKLVAVTK